MMSATCSLYSAVAGPSIGCGYAPRVATETMGISRALAVARLVASRTGGSPEPASGLLRAARGGRRRRRRGSLRAAAPRHLARRDGLRARDSDGLRHPRRPGVRHGPPRGLDVHRGRPVRVRRVLRGRIRPLLRGPAPGEPWNVSTDRQTVGFALVPLAASLFLVLPLRLAVYGGDTFRGGGADEGSGERALLAVQLAFVAWSLALVVVGIRVTHGWTWLRALVAVVAAAALLAAMLGVFLMI